MAFWFAGVGTRVSSAGATTLTPTLTPNVAFPNRLRMAQCQVESNAVITTATPGWVKIDQQNSGASFTAAIFLGEAGAANPVFTWAGSVGCTAIQWYYSNGTDVPDTTGVGAIGFATGTAATHTSPSITTTRPESLAVYVDANGASQANMTIPAGWGEDFDQNSGADGGSMVSGSKRMGASGSATGAISVTGAAGNWIQWQLELRRTVAPAGLTDAETQVVNWVASGEGLGVAETTIVNWLASGAGLGIAETQVVLWVDTKPGRRRDLFIN